MKTKGRIYPMKKLASLVGVVGISFLLGFPALAQFKTEGKIQVSEQTMPPEAEEMVSPPEEVTEPEMEAPTSQELDTPEEVTEPNMEAPTSQELTTPDDESVASEEDNLGEVAATNESLTTFLAAIEAAGLTQALNEENITIFAPSNAAFEALPEGTLDSLLQPENQETLRRILAYHVIEGTVTSSEIESGEVTTAEGSPVNVQVNDEADSREVSVNGANVIEPDIEGSNGVIHVIDQVIMPPES